MSEQFDYRYSTNKDNKNHYIVTKNGVDNFIIVNDSPEPVRIVVEMLNRCVELETATDRMKRILENV